MDLMDRRPRHSTRGTGDFKWNVGLEFVHGRPGEFSLSRTFNRCNRTWQLRLESQGRDSPPLLSIELISTVKSSLRALVSCRLCRNGNEVRTITKVCKFCKKRKHIVQRCGLGPLSSNSDLIECQISDVQHLNPAQNVRIEESNIPALCVAPIPQSAESSSNKEQGHLPVEQSTSHISNSSSEGYGTSNSEIILPSPPLDTITMVGQSSRALTSDVVIKKSQSFGIVNSSSLTKDEQQKVIDQITATPVLSQQPHLASQSIHLEVSLEVMETLLRGNVYSDITLVAPSGRQFKAHSTILSARSSKFDHMLKENQGGQKKEIQMQNLSDSSLEQILEFIYTEKVLNLGDNMLELYRASEIYSLNGLKNLCLQSFREKLSIHNASDILILSNEAKLLELKKHVIGFINQNIKEILDLASFQKLRDVHPSLVADLYVSLGKSM